MLFRLPEAGNVIENPSADEAKALAAEMPNAKPTGHGNLNVQTEVVSRSKRSTFIVTDEPDGQNQAITREEGARWAEAQDAYIAEQEMVVIDGFIGNDPDFRTPARLYIEAANANIAAMAAPQSAPVEATTRAVNVEALRPCSAVQIQYVSIALT